MNLFQNQKPISLNQSPNGNTNENSSSHMLSQKMNQLQNYSSNSQPFSQRYTTDENQTLPHKHHYEVTPKELLKEQYGYPRYFHPQANQKLSAFEDRENYSRPSLGAKDIIQGSQTETVDHTNTDISSLKLQKNSMLGFENNKQLSNNPLKDISNRVSNLSSKPQQLEIPGTSSKASGRYSLPFEIAPKHIKINNYLDQPFKQITPSVKTAMERSACDTPLGQHESGNLTSRGGVSEKSTFKVSNFEQATNSKGQTPSHQASAASKNYFDKKRLSDNVLKGGNDNDRYNDDLMKEIFERKDKNRKGHNVSVTTNTSTTSQTTTTNTTTSAAAKKQQQMQQSTTTTRKSQVNSKSNSLVQTPSNSQAQLNQTTAFNIPSIINAQEKTLQMLMDGIRRKQKVNFSLKETAKSIREINRLLKVVSSDNTLIFLLKQHTRTHFISFAFVRSLEEDLIGQSRSNENLQAIVLNALDYVKKNLKCFNDIIEINSNNGGNSHKSSKKDLNNNPFGVIGPSSTRNGSNKENYGGNSNTTNKNVGSKSEKKMFIKQNIQISLAFLKKICRLSKQYQEKFKDFLTILNSIESGAATTKVKEQISRALHQHRLEQKQLQSNLSSNPPSNQNSAPTSARQTLKRRRESMTIEIDDLNSSSSPFGVFEELKEMENEESTESNQSPKNSSAYKMDSPKVECLDNDDIDKQYEKKYLRISGNKENSPPNVFEPNQPGRLSLQPQPLGQLKLGGSNTPNNAPAGIIPFTEKKEDIKNNINEKEVSQPNLSIVTKKHAGRISNTHEPITVRGTTRPNHRLQFSEQENLQYCLAPPHINHRSNSQPSKEPYLPSETSKGQEYTLVLDLDETLVHFDPKIRTYRPRPGAKQFIQEMSKYYELVVFTAGLKDYADWILNDFDRQNYITHRLYRDHTKHRNGIYVKDLSKLGRDMTKIIIIDNIEENFQAQPDNGIPIKGWYHDPNDRELDKMAPFLKSLVIKRVSDIRPEVKVFKQQLNSINNFIHHQHQQQANQKLRVVINRKSEKEQQQPNEEKSNGQQQAQTREILNTNPQPWGSDSESEREKDSEEEEEDSEEESPPKKKPVPKKKQQDSDEEDEEEEEDSEEESPPAKKKPPPKTKEESDEEEEEEEEDDDEEASSRKKKASPQKQTSKANNASKVETEKYEKEIHDLKEKLKKVEEKLEEKDEEIEDKKKDMQKLKNKMMSQDEEIAEYKQKVQEKDEIIEENQMSIQELTEQINDKNAVIANQQQEIEDLAKSQEIIDSLNEVIQHKQKEIGELKAKINLDMLSLKVKIVADYPDMVEENAELYELIKAKDQEIYNLQVTEHNLTEDLDQKTQDVIAKDSQIQSLMKDKNNLSSKLKDANAQIKKQNEQLQANEEKIKKLEADLHKKNEEMDQRLENISKLISKNEQLNQQLNVQKKRLEKFKSEQVASFEKQLNDKNSEIEVLKEMIKGNQLQLRQKEKEMLRFKQKAQVLEGQQLAQRQQQNLIMNNPSAMLPPTQHQAGKKVVPGQLKAIPSRYKQGGATAVSQISSKQASTNNSQYFPPVENRSNIDQLSQVSGTSSMKASSRKTPIHQSNVNFQKQNTKQSIQKLIVEEEGEGDYSNQQDDYNTGSNSIKNMRQSSNNIDGGRSVHSNSYGAGGSIQNDQQQYSVANDEETNEIDIDAEQIRASNANHQYQSHQRKSQEERRSTHQRQGSVEEEEDFEQYDHQNGEDPNEDDAQIF